MWLILAFFNAAGLMLLAGAEFIAMLLVIVYVGAVAVLFLFVVMMLDIDFAELRAGFVRYLPLGALVAIILAAELVFALGAWSAGGVDLAARAAPAVADKSNIQQIGELLYTRYRSEEHTSELQSLMRISYAVFCLKKKNKAN